MTITSTDIINAYNSIYSSINNTNRTYTELTKEEIELALLILSINNGGSGGGGGGSVSISNFPTTFPATQSGTWNLNNISGTISLPTGASTSALQTTGNSTLSDIKAQTDNIEFINLATSDISTTLIPNIQNTLLSVRESGSTQPGFSDQAVITTNRDLSPVQVAFTSITNGNFILNTDISGYTHCIVATTSGAGSYSLQGSETGAGGTYFGVIGEVLSGTATNNVFSTSLTGSFILVPIYSRFLQILNLSGTVSGVITLYRRPINPSSVRSQIVNTVTTNSVITNFTVKSLLSVTGTINTSGDNTVISAPSAGNRIYITSLTIQLEGTSATTVLVKSGGNTHRRILCQNQGDGISLQYSPSFEFPLTVASAAVLNLSGANSVGYSIEYYVGA